ncbi:MAG: hypothetical protein ACTSSE_05485 [Candidatus Thorarchaeota archaeon]
MASFQSMYQSFSLQADIEPLPEPLRTLLLVSILVGAIVIPLAACVIGMIRRNKAKRIVQELGGSWKDLGYRISKTEDVIIARIQCICIFILVSFAGVTLLLVQVLGPSVQDIAVIILFGAAMLFIIVVCPIAMIWGVMIEERRNAERIQLAGENGRTIQQPDSDYD